MANDLSEELGLKNIPLSEMIQTVRQELAVAQANAEADNAKIRFEVTDVELEFKVVVSKGSDRKGKLNLFVLSGDYKSATKGVDTHTFKLKLSPVDTTNPDKRVLVNDTMDQKPQ